MRALVGATVTGSSGRWTKQAKSARSYIRAVIANAMSWFDLKKDLHIGGGERLTMGQFFGEGEDVLMLMFSLTTAFVTRPADRALKSVLKTRETTNVSMCDIVIYLEPYQQEYLKCLNELDRLRRCVIILLEWCDVDPEKINNLSDEYVLAAYLSLLSARANIDVTCRQRQLEKMAQVETCAILTENLTEGEQRKAVEREIQNALTSTTVMSSRPETAAAAMIQPEQFESAIPSQTHSTYSERVRSWIRRNALKDVHSALVERLHGLWVKTASYLKISDCASCCIRVAAQVHSRSIATIHNYEKVVKKLKDLITEIESEDCAANHTSLVELGFWQFKSDNADIMLSQEDGLFVKEGGEGGGNSMATWMMIPAHEKKKLGEQRKKEQLEQFGREKEERLKNAKARLSRVGGKSEAEVLASWFGQVKIQAKDKFMKKPEGQLKSRNAWSNYCSFSDLGTDMTEVIQVWREEPSLLVAYASKIAYLCSASLKKQTQDEHLKNLPLANADKIKSSYGRSIILQTNWDGDDRPMGQACDSWFLVVYSSPSPAMIGIMRLVPVGTITLENSGITSPTYLVNDEEVEMLTGGQGMGAHFSLHVASATTSNFEGIYEFHCENLEHPVFELAEGLAKVERKIGLKLAPEEKKIERGKPKEEKKKDVSSGYMKKKINIARADDRIKVFCVGILLFVFGFGWGYYDGILK